MPFYTYVSEYSCHFAWRLDNSNAEKCLASQSLSRVKLFRWRLDNWELWQTVIVRFSSDLWVFEGLLENFSALQTPVLQKLLRVWSLLPTLDNHRGIRLTIVQSHHNAEQSVRVLIPIHPPIPSSPDSHWIFTSFLLYCPYNWTESRMWFSDVRWPLVPKEGDALWTQWKS